MDFRDELLDDDDNDFGDFDSDDEIPVPLGRVIGDEDDDFASTGSRGDGRILGMTAAERAFLSAMVFLNVLVLGIGLLMATGRI